MVECLVTLVGSKPSSEGSGLPLSVPSSSAAKRPAALAADFQPKAIFVECWSCVVGSTTLTVCIGHTWAEGNKRCAVLCCATWDTGQAWGSQQGCEEGACSQ